MAETKMYGVRFLPVLMVDRAGLRRRGGGPAVHSAAGTGRERGPGAQMNELLALSQKIPAQANAALSGNAGRIRRAARKSRTRYSDARRSRSAPDVQALRTARPSC